IFSGGMGTFFFGGICILFGTGTNVCLVSFIVSGGIGTQTLTATYGGDADHSGSHGDFALTVNKRFSSTTVNCSPASVPVGVSTTCTATVADIGSGTSIRPGGTVTFSGGTGTFSSGGTCILSGSGMNSCLVDFTPAVGSEKSQTLTDTYNKNTNHTSSNKT